MGLRGLHEAGSSMDSDMMEGQDGQSDTGDVLDRASSRWRKRRRDTWGHASDWGRPHRGLASRVTRRRAARWEEETRDSEAELGGEWQVMEECVGRSPVAACCSLLQLAAACCSLLQRNVWDEAWHRGVHGSFTPSNRRPLLANGCEFEWEFEFSNWRIKETEASAPDPH